MRGGSAFSCSHSRRSARATRGESGERSVTVNAALRDASLGELRRQLSYKAPWYGSSLWLASMWYPSSRTCSRCRVREAKLSRSARVFHCESYGLVMDRDVNAAKNLAALAELGCVYLRVQLWTGEPVDWSTLPVRPANWKKDHNTRSSRGCVRGGGLQAEGVERKTARGYTGGDYSLDRKKLRGMARR